MVQFRALCFFCLAFCLANISLLFCGWGERKGSVGIGVPVGMLEGFADRTRILRCGCFRIFFTTSSRDSFGYFYFFSCF